MITDDPAIKDIAEFFILPDARKSGAGKWMAHSIFKLYQDKIWEIRQLPSLQAKEFWLKVISDFTQGDYYNLELCNSRWQGSLQYFYPKSQKINLINKHYSERKFTGN